ncbi:hypothetical protein D3C80_1903550 [compost metagenome]
MVIVDRVSDLQIGAALGVGGDDLFQVVDVERHDHRDAVAGLVLGKPDAGAGGETLSGIH